MRTAGLTMNDVWAHRVLRERGVETHSVADTEAEIIVLVDSVELQHRSKEENYRPYLHMTGELRSVSLEQELPYGISEVTYSPGQGEKVDAFYEFDDEQLSELAQKGYFSSSFTVPEQISGIEWELPAKVDTLVLAPAGDQRDGDVPVVFTNVRDIAGLDIDAQSSGYDLAEYFADHSKDGVERVEKVVDERGLKARSDAINSLFTEDELDLQESAEGYEGRPGDIHEPSTEGIGAQLREAEAQIAAEREQYLAERESTEGTPEHLYRQHVASALDKEEEDVQTIQTQRRSAGRHSVRESVEEREYLDLGLDEDDASDVRASLDKRKRDVERRAADLDFGDDDEQSLGS